MLRAKLEEFVQKGAFRQKGGLCVALVVTDHARTLGLPLDPSKLMTKMDGQVLGLGIAAVQGILKRNQIDKVLAKEGGRTSRGSIQHMREYVQFLNYLQANSAADLDAIEAFWIGRVREFFAAKPFRISLDASRSFRQMVRDVIGDDSSTIVFQLPMRQRVEWEIS